MGRSVCEVEDDGLQQACCSECGNKWLKSAYVLKEQKEFSRGRKEEEKRNMPHQTDLPLTEMGTCI